MIRPWSSIHLASLCLLAFLTIASVPGAEKGSDKPEAQGFTFNTLPEPIQKKLSAAVRGRTDDIVQIVRTRLKYTNGKSTDPWYIAKVNLANGSIQYVCLNDKGELVHRETTKPGAGMKGVK